jgi:hypothetical protein
MAAALDFPSIAQTLANTPFLASGQEGYFRELEEVCERYRRKDDNFAAIDFHELDAGAKILARVRWLKNRDATSPAEDELEGCGPPPTEEQVRRSLRAMGWQRFRNEQPIARETFMHVGRNTLDYLGIQDADLIPVAGDLFHPPETWDVEIDTRLHEALDRWRRMSPEERDQIPVVMAKRRAQAERDRQEARMVALENAVVSLVEAVNKLMENRNGKVQR